MKHFIFSIFLIFILSLAPHAFAENNSKERIALFAKAQQKAVSDILTCFREGASNQEWGKALQDLVMAEIGLINSDVSYKSDKLYSKLANDLTPTQYPLFGFRVYEKRLRDTGYEFLSFDDPFSGQHLMRFSGSYDKAVKIEFKQITTGGNYE
jgi:hypothetical protein